MYYGKLKSEAELEYERKYGNKTDAEMKEIVSGMISKKFEERASRAEQRQAERDAKYNLPYGELVRAMAKAEKQIKELENRPETLLSTKRKALEAEYGALVERGMPDVNRELWISGKLVEYMKPVEGEYCTAKAELQQAIDDYSIYLAKKTEWEQENADIIEAERVRTKRAELLQAEPEALRALGIEPVVTGVKATPKTEETAEERDPLKMDTDAIFAQYMVNRNANEESKK